MEKYHLTPEVEDIKGPKGSLRVERLTRANVAEIWRAAENQIDDVARAQVVASAP